MSSRSSRHSESKHSDPWARVVGSAGLLISLASLLVSGFSVRNGIATQHQLESAYFDSEVTPLTAPSIGLRPEVVLRFKNTGRSRANVRLAKSTMLVATNDVGAFERMRDLPAAKLPSTGEINPEGKISANLKLGHEIDSEEYEKLEEGSLRIYIVGELDYENAFGDHRIRSICHQFDFDGHAWVGCFKGNETRNSK